MMGYIQDARTVGTVFINAIGYTLAAAANSLQISLDLDNQPIVPKYDDTAAVTGQFRVPGLRFG